MASNERRESWVRVSSSTSREGGGAGEMAASPPCVTQLSATRWVRQRLSSWHFGAMYKRFCDRWLQAFVPLFLG